MANKLYKADAYVNQMMDLLDKTLRVTSWHVGKPHRIGNVVHFQVTIWCQPNRIHECLLTAQCLEDGTLQFPPLAEAVDSLIQADYWPINKQRFHMDCPN